LYASASLSATSLFACSKNVYVRFPRPQELKEAYAFEFAAFANAKKNQVFPNSFFSGYTVKMSAEQRECFDRMFRVVVIPRYSVKIQKGEKATAVFF
jgi:hypothetical protein